MHAPNIKAWYIYVVTEWNLLGKKNLNSLWRKWLQQLCKHTIREKPNYSYPNTYAIPALPKLMGFTYPIYKITIIQDNQCTEIPKNIKHISVWIRQRKQWEAWIRPHKKIRKKISKFNFPDLVKFFQTSTSLSHFTSPWLLSISFSLNSRSISLQM